jgi:PH domain/PX domain/Permuted papain-like amidase enzyme, YaeF/YiiX, C92 family
VSLAHADAGFAFDASESGQEVRVPGLHKAGWLVKRGDKFHTWRTRFFVLKTGYLAYYRDVGRKEPIREMYVEGVCASAVPDSKYSREFCFEVTLPNTKRVFVLRASSADERDSWINSFAEMTLSARKQRSANASRPRLVVQVNGYHRQRDWKGSFVEYRVAVQIGDLFWAIWHRYSSFEELHNKLNKKFPTVFAQGYIPSFPKKRVTKRDAAVALERVVGFNLYLQKLAAIEPVANSPEMMHFLGMLSSSGSIRKMSTDDASTGAAQVSVATLLNIAEVGDVLLMRTPQILSSATRLFTRAKWDHVAMIVRVPMHSNSLYSLMAFEATNVGVTLTPLQSRLQGSEQCGQTVAIRRLKWKRSFAALECLDSFIDRTNGNAYSLKSLVSNITHEKKEAFFCSELVAEAYRAMGIIAHDSTQVNLPGHFASDADSKLGLIDATLSSEILINFDSLGVAQAEEHERTPARAADDSVIMKQTRRAISSNVIGAHINPAHFTANTTHHIESDTLQESDMKFSRERSGASAKPPVVPASRHELRNRSITVNAHDISITTSAKISRMLGVPLNRHDDEEADSTLISSIPHCATKSETTESLVSTASTSSSKSYSKLERLLGISTVLRQRIHADHTSTPNDMDSDDAQSTESSVIDSVPSPRLVHHTALPRQISTPTILPSARRSHLAPSSSSSSSSPPSSSSSSHAPTSGSAVRRVKKNKLAALLGEDVPHPARVKRMPQ